jgi:uncharacterized protein YgbK (DUF1537 family)
VPTIGAIADDLTGATDLSLILARAGLDVILTVGAPGEHPDIGDADAVIVALKSRTVPAAEAVAMSDAAAAALLGLGVEQLFFKYCSTFDSTDAGNIGPVTDALLTLLGETRTIACPAFPANGRTVYMGHLFVGGQLLSESSMKDHPLTPMRDANLVRVLQRQTVRPVSLVAHAGVAAGADALRRQLAALTGIAIVDAICDDDLRTIGAACRGLRLVTGGSALAMGLPANFGREWKRPAMPKLNAQGGTVILAGSCAAATRRQVEVARQAGFPLLQIDPLQIAAGTVGVREAVAFALQGGALQPPLIYSCADPATVAAAQDRLGRARAGMLVEAFFAEVAAKLRQAGVARFVVAGGETSGAVVAALGVETLRIGAEIETGVGWAIAQGREGQFAIALKSGNFGSDAFFPTAVKLAP